MPNDDALIDKITEQASKIAELEARLRIAEGLIEINGRFRRFYDDLFGRFSRADLFRMVGRKFEE